VLNVRKKAQMGNLRSFFLALIVIAVLPDGALPQSSNAEPSLLTTPNTSKRCSPIPPGRHEVSHLPPAANFPDGISFTTNWTQLQTGGWSRQQAMDSCRIQPDGFLTWHGKAAVRIEVQPNDDPLALNANSERAEMLLMQDASGREIKENANSGKQYYATSYYFPLAWQGQQLPYSAFAPLDCSAGDRNTCNSWSFVWQFYGWGALSAGQVALNGPQRYLFNNVHFADGGPITVGRWTDFVFVVDWSDGSYTIWRRDEGQVNFTLALIGRTPVSSLRGVYVKQGLYRGGNVGGRTDVLWIGPTARGYSFSVVEQQAFGTNEGPK
jgi:Polysaccharide lyase